jgi:hypothetical protein
MRLLDKVDFHPEVALPDEGCDPLEAPSLTLCLLTLVVPLQTQLDIVLSSASHGYT